MGAAADAAADEEVEAVEEEEEEDAPAAAGEVGDTVPATGDVPVVRFSFCLMLFSIFLSFY